LVSVSDITSHKSSLILFSAQVEHVAEVGEIVFIMEISDSVLFRLISYIISYLDLVSSPHIYIHFFSFFVCSGWPKRGEIVFCLTFSDLGHKVELCYPFITFPLMFFSGGGDCVCAQWVVALRAHNLEESFAVTQNYVSRSNVFRALRRFEDKPDQVSQTCSYGA
jgi:hypothetical protein